jgi:acyl-CoA synthetase (AMP-forming)/AMP-acid ligase II
MMDGYLDDPVATARVRLDGWFHTGDLGRMDEAGRVYHTGRIKDMIRRSGENISAREVEEVLLTHPAVRLVAVTGVPDEIRGEEAKAYYVTAGTADSGSAAGGGRRRACRAGRLLPGPAGRLQGAAVLAARHRPAANRFAAGGQGQARRTRRSSLRCRHRRMEPGGRAVSGRAGGQCAAAQGPTPLTRSTE